MNVEAYVILVVIFVSYHLLDGRDQIIEPN